MLNSQMMGELNNLLVRANALLNDVKRVRDIDSMRLLYKKLKEWESDGFRVLQTGFTADLQKFYNEVSNVNYPGNVNIPRESFEHLRNEINHLVPRKVEILSNLKSSLFEIPEDKFLPIEQPDNNNNNNNIGTIIENKVETMTYGSNSIPLCEVAIITALEEDEMEKVLLFIEIEGTIPDSKHLIQYGHLKQNPNRKVAFASQHTSGMIDASILTAELLMLFKPKLLIMAGVLGGKPEDTSIGDVVVANGTFTIDKGKITESGFKKDRESSNIANKYLPALKRAKAQIINFIEQEDHTASRRVDIHFGSIACVRQVIDLQGYFEEVIESEDRKAIALEMESYGVVRACELLNDGRTASLIIKSVMDNTSGKTDTAKKFAAWTSAMVVRYVLENNTFNL
jgi:nucleoside phosphorylase